MKTGILSFKTMILIYITAIVMMAVIILSLGAAMNKPKDNIGMRVIIDKDTLIILDYSIIFENYTLSDGRKVDKKYADKNLIPSK